MSVGTMTDDWTALPSDFGGMAAPVAPVAPPAEDAVVLAAPRSVVFNPFWYQQEAYDAAWDRYDSGQKSTFVAMATGLGKTVLAGMMAKKVASQNRSVLFLAHRDELLEGAAIDIGFVGVHTAIEKAEQYARDTIERAKNDFFNPRDIRCVIGSVQSLADERLESWPRDYFDLIITDECHHSCKSVGPKNDKRTVENSGYGNIYKHFAGAKRFGLTGSPRRKDKAELGLWYESVAYQYLLADAIKKGDLCRITHAPCKMKIDLSKVNMGAEDLNQGDLEAAIAPYIEQMVNAVKEQVGSRRFMLFAPGRKRKTQKIRPCEAFAEGFRKIGITSEAVWGDHPDRAALGRAFKANEFQCICNADLYNEGVNFPFLEAVVLAAPTASPVVLGQRIGRGTRLSPGTGKKDCLVVTFDWQFDKHKFALMEPYQLVRPEGSDEVARLAAEIVASGEETDIVKAAEMAEERAEAERARKEEEKARVKQEAEQIRKAREDAEKARRERLKKDPISIRVREMSSGLEFGKQFDPFAKASSLARSKAKSKSPRSGEPMSQAQFKKLTEAYRWPPDEVMGLSQPEAAEAIKWSFQRASKGLADLWLVKRLTSLGINSEKAMYLKRADAYDLWHQIKGQSRSYG